jgi:4-carboxymuconolactone decarboxylase
VTRRLRKLDIQALDGEQQALYAELVNGPRARGPQSFALCDQDGRLEGPFNAMLLSPALGSALQALGARVRYSAGLGDRARELAILVVGHALRSDFEVYAHERIARAAGLTDAEIAAVRGGQLDQLGEPAERLVARLAHALATRSDLTDEEYQAGRAALGDKELFELTTLVGYYATLALQLRVFRVPVPGGEDGGLDSATAERQAQ